MLGLALRKKCMGFLQLRYSREWHGVASVIYPLRFVSKLGGGKLWSIVLRHDRAAVSFWEREQLNEDCTRSPRVGWFDGWMDQLLSTERHVECLYPNSYFVLGINIGLVAGCFQVYDGLLH